MNRVGNHNGSFLAVICSLLIAICSFVFVSCDNPYYTSFLESLSQSINEFFIISFNANKATSGEAPASIEIDLTHSIFIPCDNGLLRTGYNYRGWNKQADGFGDNFIEGDEYTPTGSVTFFANWEPITYTVFYDKNTPLNAVDDVVGTTQDSFHIYDVPQGLTVNGFSLHDWAFTNWNTESDNSGVIYYDVQEVVNLTVIDKEIIVLFAQWVDNKLALTISLEEIIDGTPDIDEIIIISRTGAGGFNITHEVLLLTPTLYDSGSIFWEVAGVGAFADTTITGAGASFLLDAEDERYNSPGNHILKLEVRIDGTLYRKNINFTIVN